MLFAKYHALGNDYLVIEPANLPADLPGDWIARVCDRQRGVGADGVLLGPLTAANGTVALRIFNPDGSEAEKSGNGLRIFARYLWDTHQVDETPFVVQTPSGSVTCRVLDGGRIVSVVMGQVSFASRDIPVSGPSREVLNEEISGGGRTFRFSAATIGNPHCVVFVDRPTAALARKIGPVIERDPRFPNRTNVQFVEAVDRSSLRLEIWERGAGYTLASGSSSCAAAAVAYRLGLCDAEVAVTMPGGTLHVSIDADFAATLTGPVTAVCNGNIAPNLFAQIISPL
ncbi:MAG: diaminopimelate epimerase [Anaerolineae bacterium]|nr:diaminopimelate epimerase [Anaerolineae bacterium]